MATAVHSDIHRSNLGPLADLRQPKFVGMVFAALIAAQAVGLLVLGTGRAGTGLAEVILVVDNLLALAYAGIAFRRAQGVTALFWLLFAAEQVVLFVPTVLQTYETLFDQVLLSDSTWRLLYCIWGAPILMMLFLPETYRRAHVKSEIFLDLFQIAIVVGLIYSTFFFLPARQMLPADAMLRNVSIGDAQCVLLLIATLLRFNFARIAGTRNLLLRLALFVLVCTVATFIGNWIDLKHYLSAAAWFNLAWAIPYLAAALLALTWTPSPDSPPEPEPANFLSFLTTNLVLVALLSCSALLMDRWKAAHGAILTSLAIAASLLAFTFRLALTQFRQHQEIAQRKAAQLALTASHEQVGHLLQDARRQTAEITQISELGSLLQACTSLDEVFRLIPDRLRRLFPGSSGTVSLISDSRNRVESAAKWGICPQDQLFSPEQCWALRRGRTHVHPGGGSDPRCSHLLGEGASVCIPLIAGGETMGTVSVQEDTGLLHVSDDRDSDAFARRRQLAAAVAEHLSLALANLNLRETLRLQAVRDPLTGLYNRRYMQEFLDRELHVARRKHRPVAVMMLDLDHFKRFNDNFGHSAGDEALATVGEALLRSVRAEDVACRYGGEEFALILPECSLQQAAVRAEEIRRRVRDCRLRRNQQPTEPLTVSIGLAAFDETTDRVDLLLKFADEALYLAKRQGRDRVVLARPVAAVSEADSPESAAPQAPATQS